MKRARIGAVLHQACAQAAQNRVRSVGLAEAGHAGADCVAFLLGIGAVVASAMARPGRGEIAAAVSAGK